LGRLVESVRPPWYTDHLCFTRVPGYNLGQLTPLQFSEQSAELVVRNIRRVKERIACPLLLENIAYRFTVPGDDLSEAEFLSGVVEAADIGILLDLCNLYVNSANYGYDPYEFLERIPMDRVVQLHLAGGVKTNGLWSDTHSQPVPKEVFELMEWVLRRAPVRAALLERDSNFPSRFESLLEELAFARSLFVRHRGSVRSC
jgi:uncharacterized protein (UPF0276 family)